MRGELVAQTGFQVFDADLARLERHPDHRFFRPAHPEVNGVDGVRRWNHADEAEADVHLAPGRMDLIADEAQRFLRDCFGLFDARAGGRLQTELELPSVHLREDLRPELPTGEEQRDTRDNEVDRHEEPAGCCHVSNHPAEALCGETGLACTPRAMSLQEPDREDWNERAGED